MAEPVKKEDRGFLDFVYDFYASMKSYEIKLVYEGKVTHQITKAFIALAEAQMEENEEATKVQRTVFHVMVECLQNISRHADEFEAGKSLYSGKGIFLISNTKKAYCVTTGNAIVNEKVPELEEMLAEINKMDDDELKELYVKQMREGRLSDKGGAGLGFIDIRRKTGEKLDYHFMPISETASFFLLTTLIPRSL
ncbi:SiaB family protein kinase [Bacteroidota bacterium]